MIEVNNLVSVNYAIRGALGNAELPNIAVSVEEDLHRWAGEAMRLIKPVSILRYEDTAKLSVHNNKVKMCEQFKAIDCVKINGTIVPHVEYSGCRRRKNCTGTCQSCNSCCDNNTEINKGFYIKGCYIHFVGTIEDGQEVEVSYWEYALDEDGSFLIHESSIVAVQEYILWMLKRKLKDPTYQAHEKLWYYRCKQARAELNKITQEKMDKMGDLWKPNNYILM